MCFGRSARTSARTLAAALGIAMLPILTAGVAEAAVPATHPDEVGMLDGHLRTIEVTGSRTWVGGSFSQMRDANGVGVRGASNLAVFNSSTGAPDLGVTIPAVTRGTGEAVVYDMSMGTDGLLYIGGAFDRVGGLPRRNVAAIDPATGSVAPFNPQTSIVRSILATPGAIFIGTSNLLSYEPNGSPSPGYDAPTVETDPSLRGHNTPPQVRDMELIGSTIVAACQCDSTLEGGTRKPAKAAIKVDANTGDVLNWRPDNLAPNGAPFGISVLVEDHPGSGKPTVFLAAGGSDFTGAYDLVTGDQIWKTDTSGSSQVVAWFDEILYVGGHFQWVAQSSGQQCGSNDHPNTNCLHLPRLIALDPANGRVTPSGDPWSPGICCKYNGVWAIEPDVGRGQLHIGGEFTRVGGSWSGSGTEWELRGAEVQAYYARFSETPTTLETLTVSFSGGGRGRVTSDPPAVDCSDDCDVGFVDGTEVTLTADPDPGSEFIGWGGSCAGTRTCRLTMDRARSVTATFSSDGSGPTCGRIAYASSRDGNVDIFTMTRKGAMKTRITRHAAADRDPAWSPDCSRIAYVSTRSGDAEIFVMDADGSNRERLTRTAGADTKPTWSPDGQRIAFTSTRTGNAEIFVMDADGSGQTNLTDHAARDRAPAWAPDGARIAFDSDRGDDTNVWTMTTSGGSLRKLTGDDGRSTAPAYSPDGGTIAFVSDRDGARRIWLIDADGDRPRRLTSGRGRHAHPSFAPSGKRIAFASTRTGHGQIWIVKPNGSAAKNISKSDRVDSAPNWS
jgi:Tol biopolymer transport system component